MNLYYYFNLAKKIKFKFLPPKKTNLIIFDHGDDQFNFLQFDKHSVFYVRGEEINLFILLMTF